MSDTPLSSIQEILERTFFHRIRQEVVDKGYLPDISDTITFPDTELGWTAWLSAIQNIITNKGFAIEIFNAGTTEARGIKKLPRIVLHSDSFLPGALGGDPLRTFKDNTTYYTAEVTPPQTVDFFIDTHLIADNINQIRILHSILALALPTRGYLPFYNDETRSIFIRNIGYYNADSIEEGIIEKVYTYEIPDCWGSENVEKFETIAKISEITLNTNMQKYMDRTWGFDTDPLVVD